MTIVNEQTTRMMMSHFHSLLEQQRDAVTKKMIGVDLDA